MLKKNLIILFIVFSILCISSVCFATNGSSDDVKNAVHSGTDTVIDGVSNLATDVRNGVGHVENGIEDALTMNDTDTGRATTDDYTATRAATTGTATGTDTRTMWIWVIVAIAAIVIVALVWYYGNQNRVD